MMSTLCTRPPRLVLDHHALYQPTTLCTRPPRFVLDHHALYQTTTLCTRPPRLVGCLQWKLAETIIRGQKCCPIRTRGQKCCPTQTLGQKCCPTRTLGQKCCPTRTHYSEPTSLCCFSLMLHAQLEKQQIPIVQSLVNRK